MFPLWLQDRHKLHNEQLVLLNGTGVPYRQLKVPACRECNNVHAGQLENRIAQGTASQQDTWIWLLKLMLGTMYFEMGVPWERDRRHPGSRHSIVDGDNVDSEFLHALFDTLKRPDPQFLPDPLGSVFEFATASDRFDYADMLYRHPHSMGDHDYAATCLCAMGRCWIAFFDDEGNMARIHGDRMNELVGSGVDPVRLFPELMYARASYDYMPQPTVFYAGDRATGVAFVPPLGRVPTLPHDPKVLDEFRRAAAQMSAR